MKDFQILFNYDWSDPPRYHRRPIDREYFDSIMQDVASVNGTILWRTNLAGRAYFHSRHMAPFEHACVLSERCGDWHKVAEPLTRLDPLAEAVRAARKHGARIFAYMPMNEWACLRVGDLDLVDPTWWKDPTHFVRSRDQSRFWIGMPCFADPVVRDRVINVIKEACSYGVDGLLLCTRSHSWRPGMSFPSRYDPLVDEFGFEDRVVSDYRDRYGADIRYEDFDVDLWHRLKGEHYTEFLRMLRGALGDLPIIIRINTDRLRFMGQVYQSACDSYRLYKDWECWISQNLVDGIALPRTTNDPPPEAASIEDFTPFKKTLSPTTPIYTYATLSCSLPAERTFGRPFSSLEYGATGNKSPGTVRRQIELARESGAAGVEIADYILLFADTGGKEIGAHGTLPRRELWEALK